MSGEFNFAWSEQLVKTRQTTHVIDIELEAADPNLMTEEHDMDGDSNHTFMT